MSEIQKLAKANGIKPEQVVGMMRDGALEEMKGKHTAADRSSYILTLEVFDLALEAIRAMERLNIPLERGLIDAGQTKKYTQ